MRTRNRILWFFKRHQKTHGGSEDPPRGSEDPPVFLVGLSAIRILFIQHGWSNYFYNDLTRPIFTPKGSFSEGKWDPENVREIVWLVKYYSNLARTWVHVSWCFLGSSAKLVSLPSLKLTASSHLKMDGWKMSFLLRPGPFSGANLLLVSGGVHS